jgi:transposase-like protein
MRQFRPLSVPTHAHPLVRRLFQEMNHQQIGILDLAERSGINKNTINDWKRRSVPQVHNLAACLSTVGLELTIRHARDPHDL